MPDSNLSPVVITGASSGIGRALALEMAGRGYALGLTARRMTLLEELRDAIHSRHGQGLRVELASLDVCDTASVAPTLRDLFTRLGGIGTIVINAGANDITHAGAGDLARQIHLIQTNLAGAIATTDAAAEHFVARGSGQIVGISSLAALQPIAGQAAYCASKAGFSMYLDALRIELRRRNITVTTILPGYIDTNIVDGVDISKLPFAVSAERAAREMAGLILRRVKSGVVPAFPWRLVRPLLGHLPERFARY
jgi:short-subunit dehydrogenase